MQFKVPQDVLREDKIVGFLTLRQLIICTLGGSITYALYTSLAKQYFVEVWLIPVLFTALITMAFAFIRFHDVPFEKIVLLFIEYNFKPRKRFWQKMQGDVVLSVLAPIQKSAVAKEAKNEDELTRRKRLEEVSKVVDAHSEKIGQQKQNSTTQSNPQSK